MSKFDLPPGALNTRSAATFLALAVGVFGVVTLSIYYEAGAGLLGAIFLAAFPAQTVFALLLGIEEEVIAGGHSPAVVSPLVRVGSEFFSTTLLGLRLPLLVILIATLCVLFRHRRSMPLLPMVFIVSLVLWAITLATAQGYDFRGAIGAATPWILVLCGYICGCYVASDERLRAQVVWLAAAIISVKAVVGVVVFARGEAIPDPTGLAAVVYYDSTLSYMAMTFLVGSIYSMARQRPGAVLMMSSAVVLLVAMRRNVIAATVWAIVAVTVLRGKWKQSVRLVLSFAAVLGAAWLVLPDPIAKIVGGFERSLSTLLTGEGDSSTTGHVNDIEVGIDVVSKSPVWGLGVFPTPQAGLVVGESDNLYIHNELLQTWARFGILGVALLVMLLTLGIVYGLRVVRRGPSDLLGAGAAVFFLASPIPLMFFPHLSTLVRFAFFTGLYLAIVSIELRPHSDFLEPSVGRRRALRGVTVRSTRGYSSPGL